MKDARRWWIEDNEANRTEPADCAKHRYLEVIEAAPVMAEIERLKKALDVCKKQRDTYLMDARDQFDQDLAKKTDAAEIDAILEGK